MHSTSNNYSLICFDCNNFQDKLSFPAYGIFVYRILGYKTKLFARFFLDSSSNNKIRTMRIISKFYKNSL